MDMTDIAIPTASHCSRAVLRRIEAGNMALCVQCGLQVKFQAKLNKLQVIANVYVDGRWDRVEHFHEECYGEAGTPFGTPAEQVLSRRSRAN
jgi:hypothetical protein